MPQDVRVSQYFDFQKFRGQEGKNVSGNNSESYLFAGTVRNTCVSELR